MAKLDSVETRRVVRHAIRAMIWVEQVLPIPANPDHRFRPETADRTAIGAYPWESSARCRCRRAVARPEFSSGTIGGTASSTFRESRRRRDGRGSRRASVRTSSTTSTVTVLSARNGTSPFHTRAFQGPVRAFATQESSGR